MKKYLLSDLTIGLIITLLTLGAFLFQFDLLESLELKTYDFRSLLRQNGQPGDEVVIVGIDDDSIAKIGRWPWPRATIAAGIAAIDQSAPKVIGLNILFTEQEENQGLEEIRNLKSALPQMMDDNAAAVAANPKLKRSLAAIKKAQDSIRATIEDELTQAEQRLDNDSQLLAALQGSGKVVLPMYFAIGPSIGDEDPVLSSHTLVQIENPQDATLFPPTEGNHPAVPLDLFSEQSPGIGHVNIIPDRDGVVRMESPVITFQGDYYPSFAVQLVRQFLNVPLESITLVLGRALSFGKFAIPLDENNRLHLSYFGPAGTFRYYSFYDVLTNKVEPAGLKNKIVLVGTLATGIADLNVTPAGHNFPGVEITATIIEDILKQNFITRPAWAHTAELMLLILIGLFVSLALPRLKALLGALISLALLVGIAAAGTYFFVANGYWIKIFYPLFLLIAGYIIITSKRFLMTEKKKELVEASAIETNRMLGLSFQGQGMLDMAFDKFRKCPIDDQMKDLLYNLGLDFERKRQFNKAVSVYEHIMTADASFKGIGDRIKQLKAAAEGAVFGSLGGKKGSAEGTVIMEGAAATAPTLGRYEIMKELGHGAMGIVYLGKDPKINRQVAIKTVKFDDDVDETTTKSVKERFFREAESAGNLNHPNIIKIYDAGEDNEISYIAMELLEGEDLKKYAEKANLLPIATVLDYTIKIADALDFAHQQGVIHRDIKPANIMLLKDGTLRITDFGIARITASSKTQTGTVLGTPSYMSPEQLSGKKVDGRSDLFSLGVMFYEMLTGSKPFEGDSIAELLYKISNEKQASPKEKNPAIPDCVITVIDKMLSKNPDERYQRGGDIAAALKECQKQLS